MCISHVHISLQVTTKVTSDVFQILTGAESALPAVPEFLLPPQVDNHKTYVISLNQLCRWLGERAEELGVEVRIQVLPQARCCTQMTINKE